MSTSSAQCLNPNEADIKQKPQLQQEDEFSGEENSDSDEENDDSDDDTVI